MAAALHAHWRQAHPEAGPAYWLTRSWGMLCWQSIYLAMVAVYRVGAVPALDRLGQWYEEAGLVSGFCLPLEPMIRGRSMWRSRRRALGCAAMAAAVRAVCRGAATAAQDSCIPLLADDLLAALVGARFLGG